MPLNRTLPYNQRATPRIIRNNSQQLIDTNSGALANADGLQEIILGMAQPPQMGAHVLSSRVTANAPLQEVMWAQPFQPQQPQSLQQPTLNQLPAQQLHAQPPPYQAQQPPQQYQPQPQQRQQQPTSTLPQAQQRPFEVLFRSEGIPNPHRRFSSQRPNIIPTFHRTQPSVVQREQQQIPEPPSQPPHNLRPPPHVHGFRTPSPTSSEDGSISSVSLRPENQLGANGFANILNTLIDKMTALESRLNTPANPGISRFSSNAASNNTLWPGNTTAIPVEQFHRTNGPSFHPHRNSTYRVDAESTRTSSVGKPVFDGNLETTHPLDFIADLEYYIYSCTPDVLQHLNLAMACLKDEPKVWSQAFRYKMLDFQSFKDNLLGRYWGLDTQRAVRDELMSGFYQPHGNRSTMSQYFLKFASQVQRLDNPPAERDFLNQISRHFPQHVRGILRNMGDGTIETAHQVLLQ
jgi:hypothetical protein